MSRRTQLDPRQPSVFPDPSPPNHDADGLASEDVAGWLLDHGAGRMTPKQRAICFAIAYRGRRVSADDKELLSELHHRIGGRPLVLPLPWERS